MSYKNLIAMKKTTNYILWLLPVCFLFSCEENLEPYHETTNRLNFVFENFLTDSTTYQSFVYYPQSKVYDTVLIEISTMGYVTDYDRPVSLRQIAGPEPQAKAGKHYIAFDDPSVTGLYHIPAGQSKVKLPVILKRDPSLQEETVILTFTFAENEYFKPGYVTNVNRRISISDQLTKPEYWDNAEDYFAYYGKVKHRFMIDAAAPLGVTIDDKFFYDLVGDWTNIDNSMTYFWNAYFTRELEKLNEARAAQNPPLGPLREEPEPGETEGALVTFNLW